jgi:hypothetical protein
MPGRLRDMIVPNRVAVIPPFPAFNLGALDVELRGPKLQNGFTESGYFAEDLTLFDSTTSSLILFDK